MGALAASAGSPTLYAPTRTPWTPLDRRAPRPTRPGDTDLAWTRLTPWRYHAGRLPSTRPAPDIVSAAVESEAETAPNCSRELLARWLGAASASVERVTTDGRRARGSAWARRTARSASAAPTARSPPCRCPRPARAHPR
ncbi:OpcA/G6PD domain-containing protein [Streptomyces sp. KL116D]|uniref:OpcA/G6PD domain-containing protein n=1 Tax=Streptomyces sp. KL116D TaxID=3045152 RepID=UPI00355902C8